MKKKISALLTVALLAALLGGCSQAKEVTLDINATATQMIAASDLEFELVKMGDKIVEKYYEVEGVTEYVMYGEATGASAEEITIFKVEKAENVAAVQEMFQSRIEYQRARYENYVPSELVKIAEGTVVVNGNYVAYIVSKDTAAARSVFAEAGK